MEPRSRAGPLALLVVSTLACVGLAEAVLRLATPFPIDPDSNRRPHALLGHILSARLPDVDARGFRNPATALADAEIVVIGDSHTYGYNVAADASFPAQLARRTGRPVYNMGVGAYGIYHYLVLLEQVASQPVSEVVLALFPANDLAGCIAAGLPAWREFAAARGIHADACAPRPRVPRAQRKRPARRAAEPTRWDRARQRLALVGAAEHALRSALGSPALRWSEEREIARARARRHQSATALAGAAREPFGNSLRILSRSRSRLGDAGIGFSVLVIPSRERVVAAWSRRHASPDPELDALVAGEEELARRYVAFCRESGIAVADAQDAVLAAFDAERAAGRSLYPSGDDGHPLAPGYAAYAAVAEALLARRGDAQPAAAEDSRSTASQPSP